MKKHVLIIALILLAFLYMRYGYKEMFCPCGKVITEDFCPCGCSCMGSCKCQNCPYRTSIPSMYGEKDVDTTNLNCPYFRRSWGRCQPCGLATDLSCQTQAYIEPENFDNFLSSTTSCQSSCEDSLYPCDQSPYGKNYQDPRWRNERYWNRQEWAPGVPGKPTLWYPTPNMTS